MSEDIRKLITLATISDIVPLDADAIIGYRVRGWIVVDSKGKYQIGDTVLYIEPDAFLPEGNPLWDFLVEKSSRVALHDGKEVKGHVLKTIKLRGQLSQGLLLPLSFGLTAESTQDEINRTFTELGVFKYEPPLPLGGGGQIGAFPTRLARKTDSERVQNVTDEFLQALNPDDWFATEKIDGTSATFWKVDGELHAAGRNWELTLDGGSHGQIAKKLNLKDRIPEGAVIQGEIYGEGIQKNPLKVNGLHLAVFFAGSFGETPVEDPEFDKWVQEHKTPNVDLPFPKTVDEALAQTDGMKSLINPNAMAEGVVWWNRNGETFEEIGDRPNFKSINNKWLLRHG